MTSFLKYKRKESMFLAREFSSSALMAVGSKTVPGPLRTLSPDRSSVKFWNLGIYCFSSWTSRFSKLSLLIYLNIYSDRIHCKESVLLYDTYWIFFFSYITLWIALHSTGDIFSCTKLFKEDEISVIDSLTLFRQVISYMLTVSEMF